MAGLDDRELGLLWAPKREGGGPRKVAGMLAEPSPVNAGCSRQGDRVPAGQPVTTSSRFLGLLLRAPWDLVAAHGNYQGVRATWAADLDFSPGSGSRQESPSTQPERGLGQKCSQAGHSPPSPVLAPDAELWCGCLTPAPPSHTPKSGGRSSERRAGLWHLRDAPLEPEGCALRNLPSSPSPPRGSGGETFGLGPLLILSEKFGVFASCGHAAWRVGNPGLHPDLTACTDHAPQVCLRSGRFHGGVPSQPWPQPREWVCVPWAGWGAVSVSSQHSARRGLTRVWEVTPPEHSVSCIPQENHFSSTI